MNNPNKHLVIFAKSPRIGRVKSRLALDIGMLEAWKFYSDNLHRMIRTLTNRSGHAVAWKTWLALSPDGDRLPKSFPAIATMKQGSGDLGHRMGRVFQDMPPGPVVIIGTDIPAITESHISQAFQALGHTDSVIGPAIDGGYWLIGLKRQPHSQFNAARHIFKGVRWSSEHAHEDTQGNLAQRNLSITLLDSLEDIDDLASYKRWKGTIDAR